MNGKIKKALLGPGRSGPQGRLVKRGYLAMLRSTGQQPKFETKKAKPRKARNVQKKIWPDRVAQPVRPTVAIGYWFAQLTHEGRREAVLLSRVAGHIPRPELIARVEGLKKFINTSTVYV